jgi:hypothetical protein
MDGQLLRGRDESGNLSEEEKANIDEWEYDHEAFETDYHLKRGAGEAGLVSGFTKLFE